jgi:hypothetical protein
MKRVTVLLLGIAVLSASGMPLRLPCCSLRKLTATSWQSDCCPIPGCTLAEKAGPAAATIRQAGTLELPAAAAAGCTDAAAVLSPAPFVLVAAVGASPPRGRPSLSLLSIYRI